MPSVAVRVKSLGKQKMGAWTSAFMIGVTIQSGQALPCNPVPINLSATFVTPPELLTVPTND